MPSSSSDPESSGELDSQRSEPTSRNASGRGASESREPNSPAANRSALDSASDFNEPGEERWTLTVEQAPETLPFSGPITDAYRGVTTLVTGGLGFIGSNVVRALSLAGAHVTVLDDGFTGMPDNVEGFENVTVVDGSVTDPETVGALARGMDYVFHLACRNIIVSTSDPRSDCEVNTQGTVNVLLAARDAGVRRIVYASSASVYGNPRQIPATEDTPPGLLSPYAASKYAGECFAMAYYESFGLPVTALRYSNVFGRMQRPDNPYCGVVSRFMEAALNGQPIRIYGDGEQTRDFTYIDDVVEATLLSGISSRAEGQVYNVATGAETSVNRMASLIIDLCERGCQIEFAPRRDIDTIRRRVLSAEKIRHDLRWTARTPIQEGLRRTFVWLQDHNQEWGGEVSLGRRGNGSRSSGGPRSAAVSS